MAEKFAETMQQARTAIRKGDLSKARRLLRQVVRDDPQNHAAWLLLAKVTPSTAAAAEYVKRAELLQPNSSLVQGARKELEQKEQQNAARASRSRWRMAVLVGGLVLLFVLIAGGLVPAFWEHVSALRGEPVVEVASPPTVVPTLEMIVQTEVMATATPVLLPTPTMRPTVEAVPTEEVSIEEVGEVEDSSSSAGDEAQDQELIEELTSDDPTGLRPAGVGQYDRWIDVNLSDQTLVAYEGNTAVYNTYISSGTQEFPTVTGQFRTYMKYETQDMNGYLIGYDYYLQDVPYVMYFFGNFAIHGAYWHYNFGIPMSHGCINASPVDAGWLFNWAPVGTTVNVHY
jgi:hypothetical protein